MTDALVKLTVDLYAPGARLSTRERNWLLNWDKVPTRRVIFPVEPLDQLSKITDPVNIERTVIKDFCHLRLTTMDDSYEGVLDSALDHVLQTTRLDKFLGEDLFQIANDALMRCGQFNNHSRAHAAWMEIWTFDEDGLGYRKEISWYRVTSIVLGR